MWRNGRTSEDSPMARRSTLISGGCGISPRGGRYADFTAFRAAIDDCLDCLRTDYREAIASLFTLKFQTFDSDSFLALKSITAAIERNIWITVALLTTACRPPAVFISTSHERSG
jgi:hypothetical protein